MKQLLSQKRVNVAQALDIVQLEFASNKIRLYYPTAVKIAAAMRVAGKAGITAAGGNVSLWRDLAKYELEVSVIPMHGEYRRSGHLSNVSHWQVDIEGELVVLILDDLTAKFHCTDALIVQSWLNMAARQAKAWAGDESTALIVTARLTDAAVG